MVSNYLGPDSSQFERTGSFAGPAQPARSDGGGGSGGRSGFNIVHQRLFDGSPVATFVVDAKELEMLAHLSKHAGKLLLMYAAPLQKVVVTLGSSRSWQRMDLLRLSSARAAGQLEQF